MSHRLRHFRYIVRVILISMVSTLVVAGIVIGAAWHYRARIAQALLAAIPAVAAPVVPLAVIPEPVTKAEPVQVPQVVPPTPTVATVVAKVNKSVVSIQVSQPVVSYVVNADGTIGQTTTTKVIGGGSGFFVSKNGLVLTNKHVVDFAGATFTVVTSTGKKYPATVVAKDATHDIALLTMAANTTPVAFGDSDQLELGQSVIAIGYALGQFSNSVSSGIISGLSRDITAGDSRNGSSEELAKVIQTDAAINPGNSGGPLLDFDGNVIGVNVATAQGSQSIGFALPINSVKAFVNAHK